MSDDNDERATRRVPMRPGDVTRADRPEPAPDTVLGGRYRLGARIGKGGMGEVLVARDVQLDREVAIKRMRAARPAGAMVERFLREALVQGRLEHPAIVPVHEIGCDADGLPYFVMKRLSGSPLRRSLEEGAPLQRVLRAFADVCFAVEFAHVRGVVHRDLKPDNIILGDFGEVYVLDWGVAKVAGERDADPGAALGTPGYMSPEQQRGDGDVDGRTDVYALGCLLFEILAGAPLAPGDPHVRPSERAPDREVPPELDELCFRATARDRDARLASARQLAEGVERFLDGDRDVARRRALAGEHLGRARAAFERDAGDRRTAMQEAARALALDPGLAGAADLVGRLMLEPPRETPREVAEAMAAEDAHDARAIGGAGLWVVVGALLFVPLLWWIAPPNNVHVKLLLGVLVLDGLLALYAVRADPPRPGIAVIANTVIMVLLARMFSPLLIAPGIAAALAMGMVLTPRYSWLGSPVTIGALMVGALVAPLALEQLGVLSATMSIDAAGVLFRAPVVSGAHAGVTIAIGAIYIVALILGAVIAGHQMRERSIATQRSLHLQAWQLRHLVPS